MIKTAPEILEKHCPSMHDLYLDEDTRPFRDRIVLAMEEYASPLKKRIEELEARLRTIEDLIGLFDDEEIDEFEMLDDIREALNPSTNGKQD